MNRKIILMTAAAAAAVAAIFFLAPGPGQPPRKKAAAPRTAPAVRPAGAPAGAGLAKGRILFAQNCMQCHGRKAKGTENGPPLVDRVYEPNHHGDIAFYVAVGRGVRQHHWRFGDMKPLPHVRREDVTLIIAYVRSLQKKAGIF
ncbi:MAG TPA: cytochrome C [Nitrospinae bacterium]|jgi:mono/diheme cytochrome c family protein|nr:cytochrome C [Nitrospinota bacterium]